jgi:hypothetical protein
MSRCIDAPANRKPKIKTQWRLLFYILCVQLLVHRYYYITRNMGQDGDGHAHFDQIWRPNITMNYMGVDQNIKF